MDYSFSILIGQTGHPLCLFMIGRMGKSHRLLLPTLFLHSCIYHHGQ